MLLGHRCKNKGKLRYRKEATMKARLVARPPMLLEAMRDLLVALQCYQCEEVVPESSSAVAAHQH